MTFINLNDSKTLKNEIKKGDVCAVLLESIQGYGGLDEPDKDFMKKCLEGYGYTILR